MYEIGIISISTSDIWTSGMDTLLNRFIKVYFQLGNHEFVSVLTERHGTTISLRTLERDLTLNMHRRKVIYLFLFIY